MGVSRLDFLKSMGVIKEGPDLSSITKDIYEQIEQDAYDNSSHVSSSFWASNFPCLPTSCDRQNIYRLLNIPEPKPFSVSGRAITLIGDAVEQQIVYRWGRAGITIGGSVGIRESRKGYQLGYADPETWLYGKMDAVLNLPGYGYVLPVDIKSKNNDVIKQMKDGTKSYDAKHYAQVQAYIYMCNIIHNDMGWNELGLKPAEAACIFYASREDPSRTYTFFVKADWEKINIAVERLKSLKEDYLNERIPPRDDDFMWSKDECQFCQFKKYGCKPDDKAGINLLSESNGIAFAKTIKDYDYDEIREKVLERWS